MRDIFSLLKSHNANRHCNAVVPEPALPLSPLGMPKTLALVFGFRVNGRLSVAA